MWSSNDRYHSEPTARNHTALRQRAERARRPGTQMSNVTSGEAATRSATSELGETVRLRVVRTNPCRAPLKTVSRRSFRLLASGLDPPRKRRPVVTKRRFEVRRTILSRSPVRFWGYHFIGTSYLRLLLHVCRKSVMSYSIPIHGRRDQNLSL